MTEDEYLAIEREAAFKSEFYDGEMFAMSGAPYDHNAVKENLARQFGNQLAGGPGVVLTSDMRVKVSKTGLYDYPDIVVVCGEPRFPKGVRDVLLNPTVIVEVLSPSTARYDRGTKLRQYQKLDSLQEYVLVAQDEAVCEQFVRLPTGRWEYIATAEPDAHLAFASVPARVPLAEIYAGVTFPDEPLR